MSSVTVPARASATRGEPIFVCYDGAHIARSAGFEAKPRGEWIVRRPR